VLSKSHSGGTEIVRLDPDGAVQGQTTILDGVLIRDVIQKSVVHLISSRSDRTTIRTLNERLEEVGSQTGSSPLIGGKGDALLVHTGATFFLPDGSLLRFGHQREREVPTATIARVSADLNKTETFSYESLWISAWVDDAVPTGRPHEFATVRTVRRLPHWPNETREGVVLAFIRIKPAQ
jgi:hypothetical protein